MDLLLNKLRVYRTSQEDIQSEAAQQYYIRAGGFVEPLSGTSECLWCKCWWCGSEGESGTKL